MCDYETIFFDVEAMDMHAARVACNRANLEEGETVGVRCFLRMTLFVKSLRNSLGPDSDQTREMQCELSLKLDRWRVL